MPSTIPREARTAARPEHSPDQMTRVDPTTAVQSSRGHNQEMTPKAAEAPPAVKPETAMGTVGAKTLAVLTKAVETDQRTESNSILSIAPNEETLSWR